MDSMDSTPLIRYKFFGRDGKNLAIKTVNAGALTPSAFRGFVSRREPVIIDGLPRDADFNAAVWSSPSKILEAAKDAQVFIESRSKETKSFGTGVKNRMRFSAFCEELGKGRDDLYLTTQPIEEDEDGLPLFLYSAPITELRKHLPKELSPSFTKGLVLSTVNAWIGRSQQGQSSGLHHDQHDNLYVLLKGKKRFTLFPPSAAPRLYVHGPLNAVLSSGVINYKGCATRADGAMPHLVVKDVLLRLSKSLGSNGAGGKKDKKGGLLREFSAASQALLWAVKHDREYAKAIGWKAQQGIFGLLQGDTSVSSGNALLKEEELHERCPQLADVLQEGAEENPFLDPSLSDVEDDDDDDEDDDDSSDENSSEDDGDEDESEESDDDDSEDEDDEEDEEDEDLFAGQPAADEEEEEEEIMALAEAAMFGEAKDDYLSDSEEDEKKGKKADNKAKGAKAGKKNKQGKGDEEEDEAELAEDMWAALEKEAGAKSTTTSKKVNASSKKKSALASAPTAAAEKKGSKKAKKPADDKHEEEEQEDEEALADAMWSFLEKSKSSSSSKAKPAAKAVAATKAKTKASASSSSSSSSSSKPAPAATKITTDAASSSPSSAAAAAVPFHFSRIHLPGLRGKLSTTTTLGSDAASGPANNNKKKKLDKEPKDSKIESEIERMRALPEVGRDFPLFAPNAGPLPSVTLELEEGQMLYLPAGWFHEVVSVSVATASTASSSSSSPSSSLALAVKGLEESHIALNFWFAPPSNTSTSADEASSSSYYRDDYWQRIFDQTAARTPGALPLLSSSSSASSSSSSGKAAPAPVDGKKASKKGEAKEAAPKKEPKKDKAEGAGAAVSGHKRKPSTRK